MKEDFSVKPKLQPVLFLDDWPLPPKCPPSISSDKFGYDPELHPLDPDDPILKEVKKWRLQMLLSVNPCGIPSLAFSEAYKRMFGMELEPRGLGYDHLSDMICNMTDIFAIQEPDETTALLFPDFPDDRILHDARIGYVCSSKPIRGVTIDHRNTDWDTLIAYAWVNRDEDFPDDVVLAGEEYPEYILPMTTANIPNTRGVYRAVIVGAANPNYFHVHIKSSALKKLNLLPAAIEQHFKECGQSIESYSVPDEFIYPGFPCLVYLEQHQSWERCAILGRSSKGNKVMVETVDYGGVYKVSPLFLYLMPREFFDMPKQGIPVSLAGLKPPCGAARWSGVGGRRILCFSNRNYWLDCLLLEPSEDTIDKKTPALSSVLSSPSDMNGNSASQTNGQKDSSLDSESSSLDTMKKKKKKRNWNSKPQFEALFCDRNDSELDVYLDEILALENLALSDEQRSPKLDELRQQFNEVLKNVKRPKNPLNC